MMFGHVKRMSGKNCWRHLVKGAKRVIVTSRFPEVAKMVQTDDCLIELGSLGPKDFMVFFGVCVFGHQSWEGHDEFLETGKEIVQKLKGSPLAAKTVGRLLRNQLTLEHWERVLESKEWELQTNENDIMPALKLSYDYLPFHLQQCFSYCALFPEDYEFESNELIHLWIGIDILHSGDGKKGIEDVGQSYLDDLVKFAFLKKNETDSGCPYYVVHDLLHELAVNVSSYEFLSLSSSNVRSIQIPTSVRHLSITINDEDVKDRATFEHCKKEFSAVGRRLKVENLRTLLMFGKLQECFIKTFCDLFREARALRTILCQSSYNVEDLLPNFSKLVHLRYLRIKIESFERIALPYSIPRLYQIKVLDVQGCRYTSSLPIDINNLINLHHFIVSDAKLHSNISEVGKLKHLKELSRFEVKKENDCFKLKQLGQLQELQVLGIYNLENVETKEEAGEANLSQKDHLQELILEWDFKRTDEQPVQQENILECLKPHRNLRKLCIRGHGGVKCPTWLGVNLSVRNLEYLCLDLVAWEKLPLPLGGLHMLNEHCEDCPSQSFINLKRLELVRIQNLEKWVQHGSSHLFPHLEKLVIQGCLELLELSFSHPSGHQPAEQAGDMDWFPSLQDLKIIDCPNLLHVHPSCHQQAGKAGNMDWFPSLQNLKIQGCPNLLWVPTIPWTNAPCSANMHAVGSDFKQLNYRKSADFRCHLEIAGKDAQERSLWNSLAFPNLSELTSLEMNKCPPLPFHLLQMLSSLKSLIVRNSSSTFLVGGGESHVKYKFPVESIKIISCGTGGKELTRLLLSYFPKLTNLNIRYCQKITGLGVVQQQIQSKSTSLPSSSVNEAESTQMVQQQQDTRGEEQEIATSDAEGLLLLPPQLGDLTVFGCRELSLQPNDKETGETGGGLQGLRFLRKLMIYHCPKFFSHSFPFPSSLQKLHLHKVGSMEAPSMPLSNLISLENLVVRGCWDLRFHGLRPLLAQGHLARLSVNKSPGFFVGSEASLLHEQALSSLSSKLLYLETDGAPWVLSKPICSLLSSSLTSLQVQYDNETECFTKEQEEALQLLTSLRDLRFIFCTKLQYLPAGLHRLANLKTLSIQSCPAIRSLPMNRLPNSLQKLEIYSCEALSSLSKDGLPSSLQELYIQSCPAIRSLPKVERLPNSLRIIYVYYSESGELIRQCRKLKRTVPIVRA